jgi:hypothetical protein
MQAPQPAFKGILHNLGVDCLEPVLGGPCSSRVARRAALLAARAAPLLAFERAGFIRHGGPRSIELLVAQLPDLL